MANDKENTDYPWHDVAIEIHKFSLLDTPNQILRRGKALSEHVFGILEHFCQINDHNKISWLLLTVLDKIQK